MPRMELEREIKYRTYKTRREILSHRELMTAIIAFVEAYLCIFPNASNPRIEIRVYSPKIREYFLYEIDTRYQREISASIEWDYTRIVAKNNDVKNFNNISEVAFFSKGVHIRYREYIIYRNPDVPWDYYNFVKVEWNKRHRPQKEKK